jgi:VanZ family protein
MNNQEPSLLRRKRRRIIGAIALLWTLAISVLFMLPERFLPHSDIRGIDVIFHFGLILVFSFLYLRAYYKGKKRTFLYVFLFATAYGIAIEFLQAMFTQSREFQFSDIRSDIAGAMAGIALFWFVRLVQHLTKRERRMIDS